MAELPAHHDTGDSPDGGPVLAAPPGGRPGWLAPAGIALAVGLVVLMVVLHLLGVFGPGSH
ncbi:hypothetical protein [Streptacidiphilus cavernicola]|uniref:Uncharacterized protein n=1 Tax=Streptacidiphilus cavernicola TaxID=3342716 RepID=A0ABV6VVC5_9ACTN